MTTPLRGVLLSELRLAVAVTRLIESGDRMLGRGVTREWEQAHAAACDVLDRCEAAGISTAELDAVIAEGATR
jgi:hypothetical protein